jgi:hypothetical protein
MTRWLALISCALAFTPVASAIFDDGAEAKSHRYACKGTGIDGKQTKWQCGTGQKCCFDWLTGKGSCVASSGICL